MNSGFRPKVEIPFLSNEIIQMRSAGFQPPFYFGGSEIQYSNRPVRGSGLYDDNNEIIGKVKIFKYPNLRKK